MLNKLIRRIFALTLTSVMLLIILPVTANAATNSNTPKTYTLSGTISSVKYENAAGDALTGYILNLNAPQNLPMPETSYKEIQLYKSSDSKIDLSNYIGKSVTVTVSEFLPAHTGWHYIDGGYVRTINISESASNSNKTADYRKINQFLGKLYSWNGNFTSDDKGLVLAAYAISRDELLGNNYADPDGGYSVPASKIESVLKQYFGVTKVNGTEFGYKNNPNYDLGWYGYKNGYYREVPDDGLYALTVPNVAKFSKNSNGTYTAVIDEYSSVGTLPSNWYEPVNKWKLATGTKIIVGKPVLDNSKIIAKQTSAKTFVLKQVDSSYQVVSINGVTIPKTLFAYEDAQKIAKLASQSKFGGKIKPTPSVVKDGSKIKTTLNGESCYTFDVNSVKDSKGIPLYSGSLAVAPMSGKVYFYDMIAGVPNASWKLVYTVPKVSISKLTLSNGNTLKNGTTITLGKYGDKVIVNASASNHEYTAYQIWQTVNGKQTLISSGKGDKTKVSIDTAKLVKGKSYTLYIWAQSGDTKSGVYKFTLNAKN